MRNCQDLSEMLRNSLTIYTRQQNPAHAHATDHWLQDFPLVFPQGSAAADVPDAPLVSLRSSSVASEMTMPFIPADITPAIERLLQVRLIRHPYLFPIVTSMCLCVMMQQLQQLYALVCCGKQVLPVSDIRGSVASGHVRVLTTSHAEECTWHC